MHIKGSFLPFREISPSVFRADRGGGSPLCTQLFVWNLHSFKLLEQVRICSGISVQHSQPSAAWICIHTLCIVHTFWVSFVSSLETLQQRRSCGIGLILLHFLEDKNRQILSTARLQYYCWWKQYRKYSDISLRALFAERLHSHQEESTRFCCLVFLVFVTHQFKTDRGFSPQ